MLPIKPTSLLGEDGKPRVFSKKMAELPKDNTFGDLGFSVFFITDMNNEI